MDKLNVLWIDSPANHFVMKRDLYLSLTVCTDAAVNSVLAIGGVGGLAIGLAGREILENLFTGLIILSSSPFEVGEEVLFTPASGPVRSETPSPS